MTVTGTHTLYAHYEPNTDTPYVVNHWIQKLDGEVSENDTNYELKDTSYHTGTSESTISAERKSYAGFSLPNVKTLTINRDGSSVVDYYYKRESYTVSFDANGCGTLPSITTKKVKYEDKYDVLTITNKTGYTFEGWYTAVSGGTKITSSTNLTITSDHTLYAHCKVNQYTLTLNKVTGISSVSGGGTYNYGDEAIIDATAADGYTFSGWTGDKSSNDNKYIFNMPANNLSITANATGNPYAVTYDCNGGSGSADATYHIYGTASKVRENFCTKTGYIFVNWKADNAASTIVSSGGSVTNLTSTYNGTVKLIAQWTPITYTIAFASNGGSRTMNSMTLNYGQVYNLTKNDFVKSANAFNGWSCSIGGTYGNNALVSNLTSTANAEVKMTANWKIAAVGDYVKYTANNYDKWRIFFNNSGQYDLISESIVEDVYLFSDIYEDDDFVNDVGYCANIVNECGSNIWCYGDNVGRRYNIIGDINEFMADFEASGYPAAVQILNNAASKYKTGLASGARSLGCTSESYGHIGKFVDWFTMNKNELPLTDYYYEHDVNQILEYPKLQIDDRVWLASRYGGSIDAHLAGWYYFAEVRTLTKETLGGAGVDAYLRWIDSGESAGLRPVVSFPSDVYIIDGDGSKDNPYVFEKRQ